MYFESREQAGRVLAQQLAPYRYENCVVIGLSVGGAVVAEQIAAQLHCVMMLLITEDIDIPGESLVLGSVAQGGIFTYNSEFTEGEIDGYTSEFHGYLDERKREAFQSINRMLGKKGTMDIKMIRDRVVILVDDGLDGSSRIDVVLDFLKPVRTHKTVVAVPVATIGAVDKVHIMADELHILDVKENYINTNHYYEKNELPSTEETVRRVSEIIMNWR